MIESRVGQTDKLKDRPARPVMRPTGLPRINNLNTAKENCDCKDSWKNMFRSPSQKQNAEFCWRRKKKTRNL